MSPALKVSLIVAFLAAVAGVEVFNELREGAASDAVCLAPSSRADFVNELFRHHLSSH